jgi:hypothetical protein
MKTINSATSKRKTTLILIIIAFLLLSAIVYAALNGVLTISGTTTTSANTDVLFSNVTALTGGNFVPVDAQISADGHTISFSAELENPGDIGGFTYSIQNVGSGRVRLYVPEFSYDATKLSLADVDGNSESGKLALLDPFYMAWKDNAENDEPDDLIRFFILLSPRFITGFNVSDMAGGVTRSSEWVSLNAPNSQNTKNFTFGDSTHFAGVRWNAADTNIAPGEYSYTMTLNFEAAT